MLSPVKIPFGLTADGRMVCVAEVGRGRGCGCICPECRCELIARKGEKIAHHFSHLGTGSAHSPPCRRGFETSIHRMAKQLIAAHCGLKAPAVEASDRGVTSVGTAVTVTRKAAEEQWIAFDSVHLEHRVDPLRPDIVGYRAGQPFIIEVTVSNTVSATKREKLRELGIPALEIDLGNVTYAITIADVEADVIEGVTKKNWLWHPDFDALRRQVKEEVRLEIERARLEMEERAREQREQWQALKEAYREQPRQPQPLPTDSLWLVCESCRHYWNAPMVKTFEERKVKVPCPACGMAVSRMPAL